MKYLVTSPKMAGSMVMEYDDAGTIRKWHNNAEMTDEQLGFLISNFPVTQRFLESMGTKGIFKLKEVPADLSFAAFWEAYAYKVGDKKRAEKLWKLLSEEEKAAALLSIPKYLYFLSTHPAIERAHAITWLNQRRWENEY